MKVIYLASYQALHPNFDITYQDINEKRDIAGDMLEVDLTPYDVIIATPPCNYWSRSNYRRESSEYSQKTKHLLPTILTRLAFQNKPFIVENVRSSIKYKEAGLYDLPDVYIYIHGRHTYWTNIPFNPKGLKQINDNINNKSSLSRQGGYNVHVVIDYWLEVIKEMFYNERKEDI